MDNVTMFRTISEALFERIKSQDFPIGKCRLAYYFAKGRHAHQLRKGSGKPYFVHCRGVAYIVASLNGTEDQICAAFLHDLLEDTDTSYLEIKEGFGLKIAELCSELRNNDLEIGLLGKEKYMENKILNMSEDALLIKLADIAYNLNDMPNETAEKRMLQNVHSAVLTREFKNSAIIPFAQEIVCS